MSKTNHLYIFATKNHPLFQELQAKCSLFFEVHPSDLKSGESSLMKEKNKISANATFCDFILDFTILPPQEKRNFLHQLSSITSCPIIAEGCSYWGEALLLQFPRLYSLFSLGFKSPGGLSKFEYFIREDIALKKNPEDVYSSFFSALFNLQGIKVSSPGVGFIYPRTIATIINEAYFALEENLASPQDLNKSMKYGVNHPMGPIEWAEMIGYEKILYLLEELATHLDHDRYQVNRLLKLKANV